MIAGCTRIAWSGPHMSFEGLVLREMQAENSKKLLDNKQKNISIGSTLYNKVIKITKLLEITKKCFSSNFCEQTSLMRN